MTSRTSVSVSPLGILKGPAFAARVAEICRVLPAPQPLPGLKYRRILMPGMVGGEVQFALLSFIAHALRLRGAEVTGLLCDRLLPACTMQKSDHHELACDRWCYRNSGPFVRAAQLPHRWYSEFITPDERTECDRLAARVPVAELKRFEWRGIALGVHVDRSVQSHFKVGAFELDRPDMVAKARQLLAAGMYLVRIGERVFEELRIDKVFMDDGQKIDWGVIRSVARARGVPVDLTLGTCRGGCRLVEHDQSTKWSDPLPWWPQWRDVPLTPDQEAELDAYFAGRATRPYGDRAWTELTRGTDRNEVRRRIGLPATPSGLVFAMFPNLGYDAAVTTDEPTYATGAEWVVATVRYFAQRPEQYLVIKLHPAEALRAAQDSTGDALAAEFRTCPPNVHILAPHTNLTAHDVIEAADVVLVYTSTVGIEAGYLGKPVVNVGGGWHAERGISIDVTTPAQYFDLLGKICAGAVPAVSRELARRYAYAVFFRGALPIRHYSAMYPNITALHLNGLEELAPGRDAAMDVICRGILLDEPFMLQDPA